MYSRFWDTAKMITVHGVNTVHSKLYFNATGLLFNFGPFCLYFEYVYTVAFGLQGKTVLWSVNTLYTVKPL